jgi:hypothetical protein
MGHREDCRAQLTTWSRVVRAYWIAPLGFSCEGSGTLVGSGFARGPERPVLPWGCREEALLFREEEEMEAA